MASYDIPAARLEDPPPYERSAATESAVQFIEQNSSGIVDGAFYRIAGRGNTSVISFQMEAGDFIVADTRTLLNPISKSNTISSCKNDGSVMPIVPSWESLAEMIYFGPGDVAFATTVQGDMCAIEIAKGRPWTVMSYATQARTRRTQLVIDGTNRTLRGEGHAFLAGYGALMRKDLAPEEEYVVPHGNALAWNCQHDRRSTVFHGPGTVVVQSASMTAYRPR